MKKSLQIAIIGCGSAGPVAGCLLARQGHQVEIFERAASQLPVGAGFMLQPSGMEVLDELGCLENTLAVTDRIDELFCKTAKDQVLLHLQYKEVGEQLFGAGTQRAAFLEVLLAQCAKDEVKVHWDSPVDDISLENDKRIVSNGDHSYGAFDLVVICDGSRSALREQLDIPQHDTVYPWGALWYIGKRTDAFASNTLWQVVDGTHTLNGFLPTGTDEKLLSFFYSMKLDEFTNWQQQPIEHWKERVCKTTPEATSFLDQITNHDQIQVARYHDVVMPHWHTDHAVVLGDAAHALSPQLGQGVNLALQDAKGLADAIANNESLETALATYSKLRKRQLAFYQFATRSLTPFFQSDHTLLGKLRDLGFPIATKSKWVRQQMTMSMAGYKNGIFSHVPINR